MLLPTFLSRKAGLYLGCAKRIVRLIAPRQVVLREAGVGLFRLRRRRLAGRRAREAGCRRGLHHAALLEVRLARPVVRVQGHLVEVEHGREAGIAAFQQCAPFFPCPSLPIHK